MKNIALALIDIYQKYISPYKGFSCAYRVATGEVGCSGYGKKVISRYGFAKGYALLQRRFHYCKCCSDELKKEREEKQKKRHVPYGMRYQTGECDCGGCDVPNCDLPSCDLPDCKTPKCGGFGLGDFCCDIPDCGNSKKNNVNSANHAKYENKVKKKMEKQKNKSVSLRKDNDYGDSDGGDGGD